MSRQEILKRIERQHEQDRKREIERQKRHPESPLNDLYPFTKLLAQVELSK